MNCGREGGELVKRAAFSNADGFGRPSATDIMALDTTAATGDIPEVTNAPFARSLGGPFFPFIPAVTADDHSAELMKSAAAAGNHSATKDGCRLENTAAAAARSGLSLSLSVVVGGNKGKIKFVAS